MSKFENDNKNWQGWAEKDALWSILTVPEAKGNRWDLEAFFRTGEEYAVKTLSVLEDMHFNIDYSGTVLDFGCGVGRLTAPLARRFKKAVGVDVSSEMIARAQQYHADLKNCGFVHNTANDLKIFEDNSFSMVFSIITLQHINKESALKYIKEFIRITAPGGLIHFQVPVPRSVAFRELRALKGDCLMWFRNIFSESKEYPMHHYGLREEDVVGILRAGCSIVEIDRKSPRKGSVLDRRYSAVK